VSVVDSVHKKTRHVRSFYDITSNLYSSRA